MFHVVVVSNSCRHEPVWYLNETHNLDQNLCYKSQMISTSQHLVFFNRMGVANVGTDYLHVHVYLNDPMTKVFLKEPKPF